MRHGLTLLGRRLGWMSALAFLFSTLCGIDGAISAQKQEKLVLEYADSLKHNEKTRSYHWSGNVRGRRGGQKVRCDEAVYYTDLGVWIMRGNFRFTDSTRTLSADYFEHDARSEKELARGHVILTEKEKRISANEITYMKSQGRALARGDVDYYDSKSRVGLTSQKLNYDRDAATVEAEIKPVLTRFDSMERPETVIRAKHLMHNDSTKIATARDSVVITRSEMQARADLGQFFTEENRILLSGKPTVRQDGQDMKAEEIALFIENDSLRQVYLKGRGEMQSNFLVEGKPAHDRLTGAEIWINVRKDSVQTIRIKGQATSLYHLFEEDQVQGINQILGDEMIIDFDKGTIRNVTVVSDPDISRGRYYPPRAKITALK